MFTTKYLIIRLFVIHCKKEKIHRIAYGAVTGFASTMPKPIIRDFNKLGFYDNRKWEYASVVMAGEARKIMGVYDDLLNGVSLKASFLKWGIDIEALKFDVTYNPDVSVSPWQTENLSERQMVYSRVAKIQDPKELFASAKGDVPANANKAVSDMEAILSDATKLPFSKKYSRIGNLELLYTPDRDVNGQPLVQCNLDKDTFAFKVCTKPELTDGSSKVTVNVRLKLDGIAYVDMLKDATPTLGQQCVFDFANTKPVRTATVKVWVTKGTDSKLVHDVTYHYIRSIVMRFSAMGDAMNVNTEWLDKLRKNLSDEKKKDVDEAAKIEHHESQVSIIGDKNLEPVDNRSLPKIKSNDMFFPKGWDKETDVVGLIGFLEWFKNKTKGAKSVFLQDPYFEDVALYFLASADTACEYTILTQIALATNPNGTDKLVENGDRKKIIKKAIENYPKMFSPMKLVVKDMPGINAKLHDRYLIFWYADGSVEGYTLSNSLQGATLKQPLLITQIGDNAFGMVSKHIKETIDVNKVETIYDYAEVPKKKAKVCSEIADQGFYNWLVSMKRRNVCDFVNEVLPDMQMWNTDAKISTLGYYLARSNNDYEYETEIVKQMKADSRWIPILKTYILMKHYDEYPIGFRNCKHRGYHHYDYSSILLVSFDEIVTSRNSHFLEYANSESSTYGVWGQFYACYFLARLSAEESIDILKQFKPTLMNIDYDRSIEPIYKSANMLMQAVIDCVMNNGSDKYIGVLLNDKEEWCRGLGALIMVCKSQREHFTPSDYKCLLTDPKECIRVCNAAWAIRPKVANASFYYKWLTDSYLALADKDYVLRMLAELMKETHYLEDKKAYLLQVIQPLITAGLIDKDFISHGLIDALFDGTMDLDSAKGDNPNIYFTLQHVLPAALHLVDGDIEPLAYKIQACYKSADRDLNAAILKDDDTMFRLSRPLILLRNLLMATLKEYQGSTLTTVSKLNLLLTNVDKRLDEIGMVKTKKQFEYNC